MPTLDEWIKNDKKLSNELKEEDIALLLDGPGNPPHFPVTSLSTLASGAFYLEEENLYEQKVEKYKALKERYGPLSINIWLEKHPEYLKKREKEKRIEKRRNLIAESIIIASSAICLLLGGIALSKSIVKVKEEYFKTQKNRSLVENVIKIKEENEQRKYKELYNKEIMAYRGYKDAIFWIKDDKIDGVINPK